MDNNLFKYGATSIVLGKNHYEGYFGYKPGKILKISNVIPNHNEFKNLNKVRTIKEHGKYFIVPDKGMIKILEDSDFCNHLKKLSKGLDINIFGDNMFCSYVTYGGSIDIMDSVMNYNSYVWKSSKSLLKFSTHILEGLKFLHEKQVAHLDIKPENIVVDLSTLTFRIIDFGFSSSYPFDDFVKDIRGTPSYFPREFGTDDFLPKIKANDTTIRINGLPPLEYDRNYVYKIDTFCFGRVLLLVYMNYKINSKRIFEYKNKRKVKKLLKYLLENDVRSRLLPTQILSLK